MASSFFDLFKSQGDSAVAGRNGGKTIQRIKPQQARELLQQNQAALLLDVRTPPEYQTGHIKGSKLLPLGELPAKIAAVAPDKHQPLILYCQSGARSAEAARQLAGLGYAELYDLGGIYSWPYEITRN